VPTSSLNLAAPLTDGEQVVLDPGEAAAPAAGSGGAGSGAATGGVVDLNRATLADLDGLPGVGPVLAQRILDWREEHGRFSSVEELQEVPGIGPSTYADLKDRVRV
jgi:competence protein ComEA